MDLPPALTTTDFQDIAQLAEDRLKGRFRRFVGRTHAFLNGLPCLEDLQEFRRRFHRTSVEKPFGTFATAPAHWYSFNHGGRNECQFNFGMYPTYFRIGVGFEMTLKKGGDPDRVYDAFAGFAAAGSQNQTDLQRLVVGAGMEVEWVSSKTEDLLYVPTVHAVDFVLDPRDFRWLFLGRLLQFPAEREILEDPKLLGEVFTTVFCGLRPYWEASQEYRASLR